MAAIAAWEGRKVMTIDVGGAFLHADIKKPCVAEPHFVASEPHFVAAPALAGLPAEAYRPPTVAGNAAQYSRQDVRGAAKARELERRLGMPSTGRLEAALPSLVNAEVTAADLRRHVAIGGKAVAKVRGGSRRRKAQRIAVALRSTQHRQAIAEVDLMFVDTIPFMVCVLIGIEHSLDYTIAVPLMDKTADQVAKALKHVKSEAARQYYTIAVVRCDSDKSIIRGHSAELAAHGIDLEDHAGIHAPHVERKIQELKEYVRALMNGGLPYRMNSTLIKMAVQFKASRTNLLPVASSTSQVCPHTVFTGRPVNVKTDVTYGFGDLRRS